MNDWSPGYGSSIVPHARGGAFQSAGDFRNPDAGGASSESLGAMGGNVGQMDGSAAWVRIRKMKLRRGSQQYSYDGCCAMW